MRYSDAYTEYPISIILILIKISLLYTPINIGYYSY